MIAAAFSVPLAAANLSVPDRGAAERSVTYDTDFHSLEAALAATSPGGVLEIAMPHRREQEFVVDKPSTIRFVEGGAIIVGSSSSNPALVIAASGVLLDGPVLQGAGGDIVGESDGIRAVGTVSQPLSGIHIYRPKVSGFARHGILLEHVHQFCISDLDIQRCGYAGVMMLSAVNGTVSRGIVRDILQPSGYVNSYGIAVSRRWTEPITGSAPRSRDILVEGVTIDGVRKWEALDTHAGENVTFRGNAVYNARTGIAIVGSKDESDTGTAYAPVNCWVVDNSLNSGTADGTADRGIVFAGAADTVGQPRELATGRIAGNIVRGYGNQSSPAGTSIQIYGTAGISVGDNTVIDSGFSAIDFYHDNFGAKATDNTIIDVWTDSATICSALELRSSHNKVTISGTTIVRMAKKARKVNDRGLTIADYPTNVVLDGGGNDWGAAEGQSTGGKATGTESRNFAQKTGFYGVAPVPRGRAIPSPGADSAELKSAIDSIRTVLIDVGLTR